MNSSKIILPIMLAAILTLAGCQPPTKLLSICPGKPTLLDAAAVLRTHSDNAVAFKAFGRCRLEYYADHKTRIENLSLKMAVNPPADFYLQGDISIVPKAVILGANQQEFWLAIKPKEISAYFWGTWKGQNDFRQAFSPRILLEALGITAIDLNGSWSFSNQGPYDILTAANPDGSIAKKIYIYNCDYSVRRIEYFDPDGKPAVTAELDGYRSVTAGFSAPTVIRLTNNSANSSDNSVKSVKITLSSMTPCQFTDPQRKQRFAPPPNQPYKNKFIIIDGRPVEMRE
jgi:hypothetical protein